MRIEAIVVLVVACGGPPNVTGDAPVAGDAAADAAADAEPDGPPPPVTPLLFAIERGLAVAGDALTLEGTFPGPVQLELPGGVAVTPTVLGSHRARFAVPAGATAGTLQLAGGGPAPISFRRAPFAVAPGVFAQRHDQAGGAVQGPALASARSGSTATVIGNQLYLAGGFVRDSGIELGVARALINADGSLGAFTTAGMVTIPRARHTATVIGKYLYLVGGTVNGGFALTDSVDRAEILPDGTLGPFAIVPNTRLVRPREAHTAAVIGDGLYVIGGAGESTMSANILDVIERAQIHPDGTLGKFVIAGTALSTPRAFHTSAVIGDGLYAIGGADGDSTVFATVERAPILPDGTLGAFAATGRDLVQARTAPASILVGNALYVVGGFINQSGGVSRASIERADVLGDGTLGPFALAGTLATGRHNLPLAVIGNYLYALSGDNFSAAPDVMRSLERARLDGVDPGAFVADGTLAAARAGHTTLVSGDAIYVIGGASGGVPLAGLERAAVQATGGLDAFAPVANNALVTARAFHTGLAAGGFVHVIGGRDAGGLPLATIERAPIGADGAPGTFAAFFGTLATARHHHASVSAGRFLYILGGIGAAGTLGTVERAIINANGSLATFSIQTDSPLATPRSGATVAVIGNFIYVLGGTAANGTPLATAERAPLNLDDTLGAFAAVPGAQLALARSGASAFVANSALYITGGRADGSVERAPIAADGTLGPFAVVPAMALAAARADAAVASTSGFVYLLGGTVAGNVRAPLR